MVSLDNLEYSYHDQTMSEMGLTPSEVEITIPSYVLRDRVEEIEYWDNQMKLAMQKLGTADVVVSSGVFYLSQTVSGFVLLVC